MPNVSLITLAHELGHACGLEDIYDVIKSKEAPVKTMPGNLVSKDYVPNDWSGGIDPGYYPSNLQQKDLVKRLLMYGSDIRTNTDIPVGRVYGLDRTGNLRLIKTGLLDLKRQPSHW